MGPEGITWTDFRGRERVKAPLSGITNYDEQVGSTSGCRIYTIGGIVQATSYLRGYRVLMQQVGAIVEANKQADLEVATP